jgi:hypothetical protein
MKIMLPNQVVRLNISKLAFLMNSASGKDICMANSNSKNSSGNSSKKIQLTVVMEFLLEETNLS